MPLTTQTMIDNVARLQVYLGDLTTEHRNMTKSYTFTSLLSTFCAWCHSGIQWCSGCMHGAVAGDVGGQMGLFAGISLLTLAGKVAFLITRFPWANTSHMHPPSQSCWKCARAMCASNGVQSASKAAAEVAVAVEMMTDTELITITWSE